MNRLNLTVVEGVALADSRNVAEMVGKTHAHLCRDIASYEATLRETLTNPNMVRLNPLNYFISDEYQDAKGEKRKCYKLTKIGCELIANKLTGKKGILFTATYVKEFNAMEKQLTVPKLAPNPHYRTRLIKTAVKDIGGTADAIAEVFGVKKGMATAAAMQMVGKAYGIDTEPLRNLLPAEATPGLLTPTAIAKALGIVNSKGTANPAEVNRQLTALGLQHRVNGQWTLTDKGKAYGENKPFTRNGHSGYVINWHESVLEVLK